MELLPWLEGYVSRKAQVLEDLAPDLDWWFSQTPAETSLDTDVPALCSELTQIFVARHANDRLRTAFPRIADNIGVSALGLGSRAIGGISDATGIRPDAVTDSPLANTVLQFSVAELTHAPGIGSAAANQIVLALIEHSVTTADHGNGSPPATEALPGNATPYVCVLITPLGVPDDLDQIRSRAVGGVIDAAIREIANVEGPLSMDRLTRTIVQRFGFERASSRRQEQIKRRVPRAMIRRSRMGAFVWPEQCDPDRWRGFRTPVAGNTRPLVEIAPEEIANAMQTAALVALRRDELFRRTAALLGISRISAQGSTRMLACLNLMLESGRITSDGLTYLSDCGRKQRAAALESAPENAAHRNRQAR
ncbi:DUF3320 domain-containing protein [Nocardia sp. NPDC050799]|uniref:DUF3320 domain-containing protein n=1 Tax=Nocardia sp. NPDC050799 TaxID=3154842 RepID=UPI0033C2AA48